MGKRILIRIRTPEPEWVEVVGVVAHQHTTSLAERGREEVYFTDAFPDRAEFVHGPSGPADTASDGNQVRAAIKDMIRILL